MSEEQTVSLVDVLEEDEELEEEASAVLAGSDSDHCSYPQVSAHTHLTTKHSIYIKFYVQYDTYLNRERCSGDCCCTM